MQNSAWKEATRKIRSTMPLLFVSMMVLPGVVARAGATEGQKSETAPFHLQIRVVDDSGRSIAGAQARSAGGSEAWSDGEGLVTVVAPGEGEIEITAEGFSPLTLRPPYLEETRAVLQRPTVSDQITITASRRETRLADTPASVVVISNESLSRAPQASIDDALRQVPGFTLFRRSGSRTANPTSQGVSLRGIGGSGASRVAVLDDGALLNDPFGGWIQWGRIVRSSIGRIEVLRGGASDLYGGSALAGVITLVRRREKGTHADVEVSAGNLGSRDALFFGSIERGLWGARLAGQFFETDGYIPVRKSDRGSVDTAAGSEHTTVDLTLDFTPSTRSSAFIRGALYDESRANGTRLTTNATKIESFAAGFDQLLSPGGNFSIRLHRLTEDYDQTFSTIGAGRNSESLNRTQTVPSEAFGGSLTGSVVAGSRHLATAGVEIRSVEGVSREVVLTGTSPTSVAAGGTQLNGAVFVHDEMTITPRLSATLALRYDTTRNLDAFRSTGDIRTPLTDRDEGSLSPRFALLFRSSAQSSLWFSGYRSFRSPTLNELYRSFRVGNVVTLSNESLTAEELTGFEGGVKFSTRDVLSGRATLFWMDLDDTIANVTQSSTPTLITRRRENLGSSRSRGLELDLEARAGSRWRFGAGYLFTESETREFSANPALVGKRIPQVPRHQFSAQGVFTRSSGHSAEVDLRYAGRMFEDDQNQLALGSALVVDVSFAVPARAGIELVAAIENTFDEEYDVGRSPVITVGAPRQYRIGARYRPRW